MSALGNRVAALTARLVDLAGSTLTYGGASYPCIAEVATSSTAGVTQAMQERWGAFSTSADPRIFAVSALLFAPTTAAVAPTGAANEILTYQGHKYLIVHVAVTEVAGAANTLLIYAHRTS